MIFKPALRIALIAAALALAGCPGNDANQAQTGLVVHFAEIHAEARPGEVPLDSSGVPDGSAVQGGYDQSALEHHVIRDRNGKLLSLYRAYLVLDRLELLPCDTLAHLPQRLFNGLVNGLIGTAEAHAGHGAEPVGGRALDAPNVIDIVTQDEFILPLGDAPAAPGRYCGMRIALVRLAGKGYGKPAAAAASDDDPTTVPEIPDLAGRMMALRADYCDQADGGGRCTRRVKVDVDDDALNETERTVAFDQPLEVSAGLRTAYLALGIAYGEWVKDVDITQLTADAGERRKLFDNIVASLHIRAQGLGDLPPNVTP